MTRPIFIPFLRPLLNPILWTNLFEPNNISGTVLNPTFRTPIQLQPSSSLSQNLGTKTVLWIFLGLIIMTRPIFMIFFKDFTSSNHSYQSNWAYKYLWDSFEPYFLGFKFSCSLHHILYLKLGFKTVMKTLLAKESKSISYKLAIFTWFPSWLYKRGITSYVTHSDRFAVVYKVSQIPSQDILSAGYKVRVITVFLRIH